MAWQPAGANLLGPQGIQGPIGPQGIQGPPGPAYTPPESAPFTLAWTATANPSIGNGTITARYAQVSDTIHMQARIVVGSTTTKGTGAYRLSGYPAPAFGAVGTALFVHADGTTFAATFLHPAGGSQGRVVIPFSEGFPTWAELNTALGTWNALLSAANTEEWQASSRAFGPTGSYVLIQSTYEV